MKYLSLTIIIAIFSGCYSTEPEKTGLEGKIMPSFKLLLEDSITYVDTKNIPIGKPVVLFYYGPHCPYSRSQMDEIVEEIRTLKNIHFYVFTSAPFSEMKKFNRYYKLNQYANITTGFDGIHFFSDYFKVTGVPYLALYDKNKKLKKAFEGKIYSKQILKALEF